MPTLKFGLCARRIGVPTARCFFSNPYGMQVEWTTIEAIAATKAIDLWILFPLGIGVNRLLTKSGDIPESWRKRLELLLRNRPMVRGFLSGRKRDPPCLARQTGSSKQPQRRSAGTLTSALEPFSLESPIIQRFCGIRSTARSTFYVLRSVIKTALRSRYALQTTYSRRQCAKGNGVWNRVDSVNMESHDRLHRVAPARPTRHRLGYRWWGFWPEVSTPNPTWLI